MIRDKSRQHTLGTRLPDSILGSLQGVSSGSINVSIPIMAVRASDYSNAGAASQYHSALGKKNYKKGKSPF